MRAVRRFLPLLQQQSRCIRVGDSARPGRPTPAMHRFMLDDYIDATAERISLNISSVLFIWLLLEPQLCPSWKDREKFTGEIYCSEIISV